MCKQSCTTVRAHTQPAATLHCHTTTVDTKTMVNACNIMIAMTHGVIMCRHPVYKVTNYIHYQ